MRHVTLSLLLALAACGLPPTDTQTSASSAGAQTPLLGGPPGSSDSADTSCNVVLRFADATLTGRNGPATDCSSGTCWVVINGAFDISRQAEAEGVRPGVLYSGADGQWREATASRQWNAPEGMLRYGFTLNQNTFTSGPDLQAVQLIPFIRTLNGPRLFDHNRLPEVLASYALTADNDWSVQTDATCPGQSPHGIRTLVFAQGFTQSGYGELVTSGKIDINYDIYRLPQGIGCSTDGVEAWDTLVSAQWQPSGTIVSERLDGPLDAQTQRFTSVPAELDVPADATSVSLWFMTSSECQGNAYDSQYGANYVYSVTSSP